MTTGGRLSTTVTVRVNSWIQYSANCPTRVELLAALRYRLATGWTGHAAVRRTLALLKKGEVAPRQPSAGVAARHHRRRGHRPVRPLLLQGGRRGGRRRRRNTRI